MEKTRIGINGFGRIGRTLFRLLEGHSRIEVVAINDLADVATLAYLLKYDSIHGPFSVECSAKDNVLLVDGREIPVLQGVHPEHLDWKAHRADLVVAATGKFKSSEALEHHLLGGAKKVILSVPPLEEDIKMLVLGVNEHILDAGDDIISNASCTTNNAAPMIKVINALCGVEQAYITTIHSFTSDQNLHDAPHRDLRRARAAPLSIIPTTTGAAKALTGIFPELADAIGGCGIRVPVPNGSLTDITFNVRRETSIAEINATFKEQ